MIREVDSYYFFNNLLLSAYPTINIVYLANSLTSSVGDVLFNFQL